MSTIKNTLVAVLALFAVASASALTWDFTGHSSEHSSSFNILDTTGTETVRATTRAGEEVFWGNRGLGIWSGPNNQFGLNNQIDNFGPLDDILKLNFFSDVFIRSFTVKRQDGNDQIRFRLDGGSWVNEGIVANNVDVAVEATSQRIRFTQGSSNQGQQGYYLATITIPDSGSSVALLGLALLGLVGISRRFGK